MVTLDEKRKQIIVDIKSIYGDTNNGRHLSEKWSEASAGEIEKMYADFCMLRKELRDVPKIIKKLASR